MSRTPVSQADQELVQTAAESGVLVTARQVERWREQGLLPPNVRRHLGRGRGSTSEPHPDAKALVLWLARRARPGRRPTDLALLAFGEGLPVPEVTVRRAFAESHTRLRLTVERVLGADAAPEDVADAAVKAGLRATIVPARVRRIDSALERLGISFAASSELKALDSGPAAPRATSKDWVYTSVHVMRAGVDSTDLATMGALARSIMPAGAPAPLASQLEYRWPDNAEEADRLLNEEGGLAFLPSGDLREVNRQLAVDAPLQDLREAWRLAEHLPVWARTLCDETEGDIAARRAGEGLKEWVYGTLGMPRLFLIVGLRSRQQPADIADTALMLLFMRNMFRSLRTLMPNGDFELLSHPLLMPAFLIPFMADEV